VVPAEERGRGALEERAQLHHCASERHEAGPLTWLGIENQQPDSLGTMRTQVNHFAGDLTRKSSRGTDHMIDTPLRV
jgi:hypothetical protein